MNLPEIGIGAWAPLFDNKLATADKTIEKTIARLGNKGIGYRALGYGAFSPFPKVDELDEGACTRIRRIAEDNGMVFSEVAPDLWDLTIVTTDDHSELFRRFEQSCKVTQWLGTKVVRHDTVDNHAKAHAVPRAERHKRIIPVFSRFAEIAERYGLIAACEWEPGFGDSRPSDIFAITSKVREKHKNSGALKDSCHFHMIAAIGANHPAGEVEILPGGAVQLSEMLAGMIVHQHVIHSDNTLNDHQTSTHYPLGVALPGGMTGPVLDLEALAAASIRLNEPSEFLIVDLCDWQDTQAALQGCYDYMVAYVQRHYATK